MLSIQKNSQRITHILFYRATKKNKHIIIYYMFERFQITKKFGYILLSFIKNFVQWWEYCLFFCVETLIKISQQPWNFSTMFDYSCFLCIIKIVNASHIFLLQKHSKRFNTLSFTVCWKLFESKRNLNRFLKQKIRITTVSYIDLT